MFPCFTVYGDYTFEVINENHNESTVEAKKTVDKKARASKAQKNYMKVMSNNNDIYIARRQLAYNQKKEKEILEEIDNLEKQLKSLPKKVKKEYSQIEHMLESVDSDIANNTWISFDSAYNEKDKELKDRMVELREDLVEVRTRISNLNLDMETMETVTNISNPFIQKNEANNTKDRAKIALQAKNNLSNIVKQVTYQETRNLLGDVQHNTLALCEFSCGRSDCYVCNLLYGKKVN